MTDATRIERQIRGVDETRRVTRGKDTAVLHNHGADIALSSQLASFGQDDGRGRDGRVAGGAKIECGALDGQVAVIVAETSQRAASVEQVAVEAGLDGDRGALADGDGAGGDASTERDVGALDSDGAGVIRSRDGTGAVGDADVRRAVAEIDRAAEDRERAGGWLTRGKVDRAGGDGDVARVARQSGDGAAVHRDIPGDAAEIDGARANRDIGHRQGVDLLGRVGRGDVDRAGVPVARVDELSAIEIDGPGGIEEVQVEGASGADGDGAAAVGSERAKGQGAARDLDRAGEPSGVGERPAGEVNSVVEGKAAEVDRAARDADLRAAQGAGGGREERAGRDRRAAGVGVGTAEGERAAVDSDGGGCAADSVVEIEATVAGLGQALGNAVGRGEGELAGRAGEVEGRRTRHAEGTGGGLGARTGVLQGAARDGQPAGADGAIGTVGQVGDRERTGVQRGTSAVGVSAAKLEEARAILGHAIAAAGDHIADQKVDGGGAISNVEGDIAIAETQAARVADGRGVGVGERVDGDGAVAAGDLGRAIDRAAIEDEATAATDHARGEVVTTIDGHRAAREGDDVDGVVQVGAAISVARGGAQGTAGVDRDVEGVVSAKGIARPASGRELERAGVDHEVAGSGRARAGVVTCGQLEGARADLGQGIAERPGAAGGQGGAAGDVDARRAGEGQRAADRRVEGRG